MGGSEVSTSVVKVSVTGCLTLLEHILITWGLLFIWLFLLSYSFMFFWFHFLSLYIRLYILYASV